MAQRLAPPAETFIEHMNNLATRYLHTDTTTHAVPWGGTRNGTGLVDYIKAYERTTRQHAHGWITEMALAEKPPFYWLSIRQGIVLVIRRDPDNLGGTVAVLVSDLGLCDPGTAATIALTEHGDFYDPHAHDNADPATVFIDGEACASPPPRRAPDGQWLITPEALARFVALATQARHRSIANAQAAQAARDAIVDSRHGVDLDYIRGLLHAAQIDPDELHAHPAGDHTVAGFRLRDNDITKLADLLAYYGVIPICREEAHPRTDTTGASA